VRHVDAHTLTVVIAHADVVAEHQMFRSRRAVTVALLPRNPAAYAPYGETGGGGTAIAFQPELRSVMNNRVRRTVTDTLISASAIALVFIVLVAADIRVREQVTRLTQGGPVSSVAAVRMQVREVGAVMYTAAKHRSIDHGPLLVFVGAAGVLLLAMLRS
jgi:hypothetical protein